MSKPYINVLYLYKNFELKRGWAYNTYYTVGIPDNTKVKSNISTGFCLS